MFSLILKLQALFEKLKKLSPEKVSWDQNQKNAFTYPTSFFWDDGKNYSILSISIEDDGKIRNKYISFILYKKRETPHANSNLLYWLKTK